MNRRTPSSTLTYTLFPYTTLFRSSPRGPRTTGPIGAAACRPSLEGAYPPLFSGCELGARTRPRTGTQKRETSPPVVADERLAVGRAAASASIFFSAAVSVPAGTSIEIGRAHV